jgi:hypothetical protein
MPTMTCSELLSRGTQITTLCTMHRLRTSHADCRTVQVEESTKNTDPLHVDRARIDGADTGGVTSSSLQKQVKTGCSGSLPGRAARSTFRYASHKNTTDAPSTFQSLCRSRRCALTERTLKAVKRKACCTAQMCGVSGTCCWNCFGAWFLGRSYIL